MRIDQAIEECHQWVREHADQGEALLDAIYRQQLEADIKFRGKEIATFLRPVFLSRAQNDLVRRASQVLLDCAERLIEQYMVDPEVRETIGLPPDEEEFALLGAPNGDLRVEVRASSDHSGAERELFVVAGRRHTLSAPARIPSSTVRTSSFSSSTPTARPGSCGPTSTRKSFSPRRS